MYWWLKKRRRQLEIAKAKEAPHLWATREIERLEAQKVFEKGKVKEFYFRLSEILRRYLEAIRGFPAAEYTVEEIARYVQEEKDRQLLVLLRQADLVKFADAVPTAARKDDELKAALAYIRATAPPPESAARGRRAAGDAPMMFRFAYPAVLALLVAVAGWVAFALWRKPPSLGHPGTSTLIRMAGSVSRIRGRIPLILRAALPLAAGAGGRPPAVLQRLARNQDLRRRHRALPRHLRHDARAWTSRSTATPWIA